jgi:hypothetical protein
MQFKVTAFFIISVFICVSAIGPQAKSQTTSQPSIPEVIRQFTEAETKNKIARNNYTFTQDVDFLRIGEAGSIAGRYHRVSDIIFDDLGNRVEKITYFPPPTVESITKEDLQDFGGVQPFALTTEDLPKYQLNYVGKEKIDELNTYVFEVKPRQMRKGERYIEGRIWVDDQDLQIVKVAGQAVPQFEDNKFPHFETYRENIDGHYWFPTYTYADETLEFKKGPPLHLRMTVRYTNYKKFSGRIRLADEGEPASDEDLKPTDKAKTATPAKPPDQQPKPELKRPPNRP